jgi:hypothetical protein
VNGFSADSRAIRITYADLMEAAWSLIRGCGHGLLRHAIRKLELADAWHFNGLAHLNVPVAGS